MSPPNKRRRLAATRTTADIQLSNITSNHFLGHEPRTWMQPRSQSNDDCEPHEASPQPQPETQFQPENVAVCIAQQEQATDVLPREENNDANMGDETNAIEPIASDEHSAASESNVEPATTLEAEEIAHETGCPSEDVSSHPDVHSASTGQSLAHGPAIHQDRSAGPQGTSRAADEILPHVSMTTNVDSTGASANATAVSHLPVFNSRINFVRMQMRLDGVAESRINWVRSAIATNDLFFLLVHQLFCLWTFDGLWIRHVLGFGPQHEIGFRNLESLLFQNSRIPRMLLEFFSIFINSRSLLQHNGTIRLWVDSVKLFLEEFGARWRSLYSKCLEMETPPSARVVACFLRCYSSKVFQHVIFVDILRRLFPATPRFRVEVIRLFEANQNHFLRDGSARVMNQPATIFLHQEVQTFAQHFVGLRQKHFQLATGLSRQSHTHSHLNISPQLNTPVTQSRSHIGLAPVMLPQNRASTRDISPVSASSDRQRLPHMSDPASAGRDSDSMHSKMQVGHYGPDQESAPTSSRQAAEMTPPFTEPHENQKSVSSSTLGSASHQAFNLQSPSVQVQPTSAGNPQSPLLNNNSRLYTVFHTFLVGPKLLDPENSHIVCEISVPQDKLNDGATISTPPSSTSIEDQKRLVGCGTFLLQLRCIKLSHEDDLLKSELWHASPTVWPNCCFFSIDDHHIEVRKRPRHSKDLCADITSLINGKNTLRVSYFPTFTEPEAKYGLAIEIVKCFDHATIINLPTVIDQKDALDMVARSSQPTYDGKAVEEDSDMAVLHTQVSIDILDPITSKLCILPARGKQCLHKECFDFDSFLKRHSTQNENDMDRLSVWLCPICNGDATPSNLVIDGFLQDVSEQIRKQGSGHIQTILVEKNGSWKPKLT